MPPIAAAAASDAESGSTCPLKKPGNERIAPSRSRLGSGRLCQQLHDLIMPAARGPRQGCGPRRVVRQAGPGAAAQKKLHHRRLAEFGRIPQRRGTEVLVAGMQIGAAVDEERGVFHVAPPREAVQRRDRSEERRVGKEGKSRWSPYHYQ